MSVDNQRPCLQEVQKSIMISKIAEFIADLAVKVALLGFFWTLFQAIRSAVGH